MSSQGKTFSKIIRYAPIAILVFVALQYSLSAFTFRAQTGVVYWGLGSQAEAKAGGFRYLKDASIIAFGIIWPFYIISISRYLGKTRFSLTSYFSWLAILFSFSFLPFFINEGTEIAVAPGGIRWLLGLHAALGTYLIFLHSPPSRVGENYITHIITIILLMDIYFMSRQGDIFDLARARGVRLPGMFSVAGASGYFALAAGLVVYQFRTISTISKAFLILLAIIVAFWSGTRFALIGLIMIVVTTLVVASARDSGKADRNRSIAMIISFSSLFAILPVALYGMLEMTMRLGRGNPFDQSTRGGRLWNLNQAIDNISNSNILEILFGRGLGTGTNSSVPLLAARGIDPNSVKWNILVDNTLLTAFFQFGLVSCCIFFLGIISALRVNILRRNFVVTIILIMGLFTQNILEQVSLMIGFAVAYATTARTHALKEAHYYPT